MSSAPKILERFVICTYICMLYILYIHVYTYKMLHDQVPQVPFFSPTRSTSRYTLLKLQIVTGADLGRLVSFLSQGLDHVGPTILKEVNIANTTYKLV